MGRPSTLLLHLLQEMTRNRNPPLRHRDLEILPQGPLVPVARMLSSVTGNHSSVKRSLSSVPESLSFCHRDLKVLSQEPSVQFLSQGPQIMTHSASITDSQSVPVTSVPVT